MERDVSDGRQSSSPVEGAVEVERPTEEMRELFGLAFAGAERFAAMLRASFSAPTGEGWSGRGSCPGCGRATLSTLLRWCPSCRLAGRWPTSGPVPVFPESWWRFCGQI